MAFVGSLITTVKANTKPFRKDLKKAAKATKKLKKQLRGIAVGGAKFAAVIGGVVAVALIAYTVKAFKAIDATKKLADELQIATSDLISYQLAAGLSGTTTETLNKALQRMARTVGEARSGITTGTKALEDFGIKIEELQGLTTAEIFETFAQKISEIEDPMVRAAKAALIFGKAGQKLLIFLSLGKTGLAEVKAEAEKLGIAFNEVDARKVEQANDAILKMSTVASGLGNTLAIAVAPFITLIADKMSDFIKASGGIDDLVKGGLKDFTILILKVVDFIKLGEAAWKLFSGTARLGIAGIITPLAKLNEGVRFLLQTLGKDVGDKGMLSFFREELIKDATQDIKDAEKAFGEFQDSALSRKLSTFFSEVEAKSKEMAKNLEKSKISQQGLTTSAKEHVKALKEAAKLAKEREAELKNILSEVQSIFEETRTPLEKIESEIKNLMDLFDIGAFEGIEGAFVRKLEELKKAQQDIKDALFDETFTQGGFLEKQKGNLEDAAKTAAEIFEEKFLGGLRGNVDDTLGQIKKAGDRKDFKAGFKQIDVKNINIEGLTKFRTDLKGGIEKKQLDEAKRQTEVLENIEKNIGDVGSGAVAL